MAFMSKQKESLDPRGSGKYYISPNRRDLLMARYRNQTLESPLEIVEIRLRRIFERVEAVWVFMMIVYVVFLLVSRR